MSETGVHLNLEQIQAMAEGPGSPEAREHLDGCFQCRRELELAQRLDRVLRRLPRTPADPMLAARIVRALPPVAYAAMERQSFMLGMAAALLVLIGVVLFYEVVAEVQVNGALDLFSVYANHPEMVTSYPVEVLNVFLEMVPVLELILAAVALSLAALLVRRFWTSLPQATPPLSKRWLH